MTFGATALSIVFDKANGFIRYYDGTKYLALFDPDKYDTIFDRSRYLIGLKSGITYLNSFNYAKIKNDSDDDLPPEKTLTMHNVYILFSRPVLLLNVFRKMFVSIS